MTKASEYLNKLAKHLAAIYADSSTPRAILLTGSAAEGISDFHSDLDMIVYHDALPDEQAFAAFGARHGGENIRFLGDRSRGETAEFFRWHGVECQVGHTTLGAWEQDMRVVLEQLDVASPLQKALSGMLDGLPLYGEALIHEWQTRIAEYPDALARAMVEKHLTFIPLWALEERLAARDALLWRQQISVEISQNLLGVLAGLNRLYFSTFQFKRAGAFISKMRYAPPALSARLEAVFQPDTPDAIRELQSLVADTLTLVEQHRPDVDTSEERRKLMLTYPAWHIEHHFD